MIRPSRIKNKKNRNRNKSYKKKFQKNLKKLLFRNTMKVLTSILNRNVITNLLRLKRNKKEPKRERNESEESRDFTDYGEPVGSGYSGYSGDSGESGQSPYAYTFNSDSERTKTIKGATFKISSLIATPGTDTGYSSFEIQVKCTDSSRSCKCSSSPIYTVLASIISSQLPWTIEQGWNNLTEDCEDSSVAVELSDIDTTNKSITMKWVDDVPSSK